MAGVGDAASQGGLVLFGGWRASFPPGGFSQGSPAPESKLPALLQPHCAAFRVLLQTAVTDHKLNN